MRPRCSATARKVFMEDLAKLGFDDPGHAVDALMSFAYIGPIHRSSGDARHGCHALKFMLGFRPRPLDAHRGTPSRWTS